MQCEICSKQFAALGNFQAHKKIHTGIRDQICPMCNKAFLTSGESCTRSKKDVSKCNSYLFNYLIGDLTRHLATHTGIKNHHCEICGKSFTRNRDMVAHKKKLHLMNERAANEVYKCRECHKVFATALSLNTHYRIHANAMPTMMPTAPIAPIATSAIGGSHIGGSFGLGPPTGHGPWHQGGTISMMHHTHTQRLHPY